MGVWDRGESICAGYYNSKPEKHVTENEYANKNKMVERSIRSLNVFWVFFDERVSVCFELTAKRTRLLASTIIARLCSGMYLLKLVLRSLFVKVVVVLVVIVVESKLELM